jgi:hypothetical protein
MIAINIIPTMHRYSLTEDMRSRVYQISEVLLFSGGYPEYWDETNVESIGLSQNFYVLSATKVQNLKNLCQNNYQKVRELLGQDYSTDIVINMTYQNDSSVFLCKQRLSRSRPEYVINRLAVLDDDGELSIVKFSVGLIK